jgi:hypothetical protein
MSIQVVEQAGKGEISRANDGKITASRTFLVYEDEGNPLPVDGVLDNSFLPQIGDPHPDTSDIIIGSYSIRQHQDRSYAYEITFSYAPPDEIQINAPEDPLNEDEDSGVIDGADPDSAVTAFAITVSLSIVDIWKSNPTIPYADIDNPPRVDIGGTLVSEGGYPISLALPTAKITINQRFTGFFFAGTYLSNIGKRNLAEYHGFDSGSLLFMGVNVSQDTYGFNEITFEMAFDNDYHLRQVPERDEDGNPKISLFVADPNELNVFFIQPFPETVSFGFLPY